MPDAVQLIQSLGSGIGVGLIYGLIGIGFCVIYNASGIVNFAQGAFVMLGGMVTYVGLSRYGLPLPIAAVVSIALVSAIGVLVERLVVRPLWNRNSTMFVMILATLAAQIVIERLTQIAVGDQPRTLPMFTDFPPVRVLGTALSYQFFWIVGCSILVIEGLSWFFASTKTGKAMRA